MDDDTNRVAVDAAGGRGKYITLGLLLFFVAVVFVITVLKFAKVF